MFNHVIWDHQILVPQKATHRKRLQWLNIPVSIRLWSTFLNSAVSSVWSPEKDCVFYFKGNMSKKDRFIKCTRDMYPCIISISNKMCICL